MIDTMIMVLHGKRSNVSYMLNNTDLGCKKTEVPRKEINPSPGLRNEYKIVSHVIFIKRRINKFELYLLTSLVLE